jgi:hypothetical protein
VKKTDQLVSKLLMLVVNSEHIDVARKTIQMYLIAARFDYYFLPLLLKTMYQRLRAVAVQNLHLPETKRT